jgi:integrase
VRRRNSKKTLTSAQSKAEHIARIWGDETDLHECTLVDMANTFLEKRRTEKNPRGKTVSEEEIRKESQVLGLGCREGRRLGLFSGEPKEVIPDDIGPCRVRTRCPSPDELRRLRGKATRWRWQWIQLYASTGADISELHKVRRDTHVDLERGKFGKIFLDGGKTPYRRRWTPLTAETRRVVDELLEMPDKGRHASRIGMLMPAYWSSSSFAKTVRPWCDSLGIERIVVKDLRRHYCTELCKAGVLQRDCERLMGHANSTMIKKIYNQQSDSSFDYVADALPSLANASQAKVIPIGICRENDTTPGQESAENA